MKRFFSLFEILIVVFALTIRFIGVQAQFESPQGPAELQVETEGQFKMTLSNVEIKNGELRFDLLLSSDSDHDVCVYSIEDGTLREAEVPDNAVCNAVLQNIVFSNADIPASAEIVSVNLIFPYSEFEILDSFAADGLEYMTPWTANYRSPMMITFFGATGTDRIDTMISQRNTSYIGSIFQTRNAVKFELKDTDLDYCRFNLYVEKTLDFIDKRISPYFPSADHVTEIGLGVAVDGRMVSGGGAFSYYDMIGGEDDVAIPEDAALLSVERLIFNDCKLSPNLTRIPRIRKMSLSFSSGVFVRIAYFTDGQVYPSLWERPLYVNYKIKFNNISEFSN